MSKPKMVFYGALGSLVTVLIWSFIGGCHTSTGPAPAPESPRPSARGEVAPSEPVSEQTLIEEGIIPAAGRPRTAEPVREEPAEPARERPAEAAREGTAAAPEVQPAAARFHTVERGDTLWGISRDYGVTVRAIEEANNLDDPGRLSIGQRLVIP